MPEDARIRTSWLNEAERVLREFGRPMHYVELTQAILDQGRIQSQGATPAKTLGALIYRDGGDRFVKVDRAMYALRSSLDLKSVELNTEDDSHGSPRSVIKAFGVHWDRDIIDWEQPPHILGRQVRQSDPVCLDAQVGVYLLLKSDKVIYAGQTTALFERLKDHRRNRFALRWDRFSWFGLREVRDDGSLSPVQANYDSESVVDALEGVLMETFEPYQNRRAPQNFDGIEFEQVDSRTSPDSRCNCPR